MISENQAVGNSSFATVGAERICVRKWRYICWLHIHGHCYGLQVSRNGILYIDSDNPIFYDRCMAFMYAKKSTKAVVTKSPKLQSIVIKAQS